MTITLTDFFCGAGGSSAGAALVNGVELKAALNHWDRAIETHAENHPAARHILADISQFEPSLTPRTTIAWLSPSCTKHSIAQGKKLADAQPDLFGEVLPDAAAERSRATMWDVVRFSEYHHYEAVIVENVVEVTNWPPYRAWLVAMDSLGYNHEVVMLNSMHAQLMGPGAPQSRDRFYAVFWRRGNRKPDLHRLTRPNAICPECGPIRAMQSWKRTDRAQIGKYRSQYVYRCPNVTCRNTVVEPIARPAADIIDWSLKGQRIGDRTRPLAEKTMKRIQAGIDRYWGPLIVPVEGREGKRAAPTTDPMRTMTTRSESALTFIAELRGGNSDARAISAPLATVTASGNHHALVTSYYSTGHGVRPANEPLSTVTTVDRHGLIMRNNSSKGDGAEMVTPANEPVRTVTTHGHQSLLAAERSAVSLDDVRFRMLEPSEIKRAMDFPAEYIGKGTRREQVRLWGNAVTPPAARDLVHLVAESLGRK